MSKRVTNPPLETRVSPAIYEQWFGRAKRPPPRQCIGESCASTFDPTRPVVTREWRFYYSDGTTETLTLREPVK